MKLAAMLLCPVIVTLTVMPFLIQSVVATEQAQSATIATDQVKIQTQFAQLVRGEPGKEYPDYKVAKIQYPQVSGLEDPVVLGKVQDAIGLKAVFGQSLEEMRQEFQTYWWLSEISYKVNYNQNGLLDLTFTRSGLGAYPSFQDVHVVVDLRTGKRLTAADLFKPDALPQVVALVNAALESRVQTRIAELRSDGVEAVPQLKQASFQPEDLGQFSVSDRGITFFYEYELPHAIKAMEPSGRFFFTYDQLQPYLQPEGALALVLRSPEALRNQAR